jgi:tetratricopeptide (TPR) repeat protein
MAHYYDYPAHMPVLAYILLFAIPVAIVTFVIWAVKRNHKYLVFGCIFFTVNVMFLLQIVPVGTAFMADRFTYIAYIGLFFITAKLYQFIIERSPRSFNLVTGILAIYCVALGAMAFEQSKAWKDTFSLCENYIKRFPDSYYGYNQAGVNYLKLSVSKETDDEQKPKMLTEARSNFENALNADSLNGRPFSTISSDIFQNTGIVCGLTGENDQAIYYFSAALALTPKNIEAIKNRAYQYLLTKKFALAIVDYNTAIKLVPNDPNLYYLRANCYYSKGDLANAREDLDKAISMNTRDPNCFIARSVINRAENKLTEARSDALIAKNLGADVPAVYFE